MNDDKDQHAFSAVTNWRSDRRRFLQTSLLGGLTGLASSHGLSPFAWATDNANPDPAWLAADPNRPQYHFLPAANWMNDPNGTIFHDGLFHMFYQYNPHGGFWGTIHWGHATSRDLLHWQHQPVAMAPSPGGPDKDGVFSGSAGIHNGVPTLIYTGVNPEVQCLATSIDGFKTWQKYPANPIIAGPPKDLTVTGFRDPCVWQEGGVWYMVVGTGFRKIGGAALIYRSSDLCKWEYLHPFCSGTWSGTPAENPVDSGEMWECPDFFELDGKHVFFYSTRGKVFYNVGTYKNHRFEKEREGQLDFGSYYAPKSVLDPRGRRILWGWIPETRPLAEHKAAGWAGSMSLPRVLRVGPDNRLRITPLPELERLRVKNAGVIEGLCGELTLNLIPAKDAVIELKNEAAPKAYARIQYSAVKQKLSCNEFSAPLALEKSEPLQLRLFVDGSVLELFANDRVCITARVYGSKANPLLLSAPQDGRSNLWLGNLQPVSSDRLTS